MTILSDPQHGDCGIEFGADGLRTNRPPTWQIVAGALAAGVLTDQAIRAGVLGLATGLLVACATAVLLASGRLASRESKLLVAAAPAFGVWVAVRTSPWLVPLDLLAALVLLFLGSSLASGGSLTNTTFAGLRARTWHALGHLAVAPAWTRPLFATLLSRVTSPGRDRVRSIVAGSAVAIPVVLILGGLLASADAVFASVFRVRIPINGGTVVVSTCLIGIGAWTLLGLARLASAEPPATTGSPRWRLGQLECKIVLISVQVLFGLFTISQLVALSGAADHILQSSNTSYADYARSGFFQLLWVAGLTVTGLLALRAFVDPEDSVARRSFVRLSLPVIALTLLIVGTAIRRLALYENAYGLTMLRLYSLVFAVWIAAVLALLALQISRRGGDRAWFPAASGACALVILLALNAVNPEATITRHNLTRPTHTVAADTAYLSDLSYDAIPTLSALLPQLDAETRADVIARICASVPGRDEGWAGWNLSRERAQDVRARLCAA